jgi:hypothetical protein
MTKSDGLPTRFSRSSGIDYLPLFSDHVLARGDLAEGAPLRFHRHVGVCEFENHFLAQLERS